MACNSTGGGGCKSGGGCYKHNQEHKPPTTGDANNNHNQITCLKCNSSEATIFIGGDGGGRFYEDCFRNNLYGNFKLVVTSNAMILPLDKVLVAFSGGTSSRMVKNLDSASKFLMYLRFLQVFLDNQLEGMINHNRIYIAPSHIEKDQGEGSNMPIDPHHKPTIIPPSTSQPQRKQRHRKPKRKDTEIPLSSVPVENVADEAVYKERDDSGGPRPQDTLGDRPSQTRIKLKELMEILSERVLDLDTTKTAQAQEITSLKKRVKKLERKKKSGTHGLKRKIHDIDADEDITLENVHDADMFRVHDLDGNKVFVETKEHVVNTATTTSTIPVSAAKDLSDVDITLAQALAELKSVKPKAVITTATTTTTTVTRPKAKEIVIQEQEQASTPITSLKDKGKGIMFEEPLKMKKKDQVLFDKQEAIRLQAQFDKEERIAREKEEANATLIAQWNDIQDKVGTDYELAQRLQAEEQEELTIKEKSKLFQQLLEKRRKFLAAKRAKKKRNKPPTKAQQRSIMTTYLKNMAGWKPKDIKTKSFANVQELFDKEMKKLEQEPLKKQKMEDDKETVELQSMMEVIPDEEEVVVDAIPLATKPPSIVD
ncbi:putative ribonuclease H-like domain-containing protein [Tanacetum coccineum]